MDEPIFKLPNVGKVGPRSVDAQYMMEIEARAKRLEDACKLQSQNRKLQKNENRQLSLPGMNKTRR